MLVLYQASTTLVTKCLPALLCAALCSTHFTRVDALKAHENIPVANFPVEDTEVQQLAQVTAQ